VTAVGFFRRLYKYMGAAANKQLDERADPKVQIEQAIQEAQRQHQALSQQAATVIGNMRQIEMRLARQVEEQGRLTASARQALVLADQAAASGDAAKRQHYEETAQAFASQLIGVEAQVEDLKKLHEQARGASEQAKVAVEQNAQRLQQNLAQRTQLLSQLEAAKMQEQMANAISSVGQLAAPGDTPTLDTVRDRIEQRYATAMGRQELAQNSMEGRMLEVQKASIDGAAAARLDQLRASLPAPEAKPQLEQE
jgi:phage shock protein A